MPSIKQKTHKGIKKRFKVTATGKVMHKRCGSSHLNSHKSGKQIRRLRKKSVLKVSKAARTLRLAVHQEVNLPDDRAETRTDSNTPDAPPQA